MGATAQLVDEQNVSVTVMPEVVKAIQDFVKEKATGKLELHFNNGGMSAVQSTVSKKYR
jgi:hypothetical protein